MGGGVWQDNFDGTFTQLDDDYYVPATGWSYLDLYLMGMIPPAEDDGESEIRAILLTTTPLTRSRFDVEASPCECTAL